MKVRGEVEWGGGGERETRGAVKGRKMGVEREGGTGPPASPLPLCQA